MLMKTKEKRKIWFYFYFQDSPNHQNRCHRYTHMLDWLFFDLLMLEVRSYTSSKLNRNILLGLSPTCGYAGWGNSWLYKIFDCKIDRTATLRNPNHTKDSIWCDSNKYIFETVGQKWLKPVGIEIGAAWEQEFSGRQVTELHLNS